MPLHSLTEMWFVFALLAAVFYALLWVIVRATKGLPSSLVTVVQFLFGPIIFFGALFTTAYPWGAWWWWAFLIMPFIVNPLVLWAMTVALHRTPVTVVKPLSGLSSISTLAIGALFFREPVGLFGVIAILLATAGLLLLYRGRWETWLHCGPWITLFGALYFGVNAAVLGAVLRAFPYPWALLGIYMSGPLLLNASVAIRQCRGVRISRSQFLLLASLPLVSALQDLFTLIGFSLGPSAYVISVKRMSILLTAFIGYVWLGEREQSLPRLLLSSGIVVAGTVLMILS